MKTKSTIIGTTLQSCCTAASWRGANRYGFALMEIIIMLVIIGIIGASTLTLQRNSWNRTGSSNRMLIAGQMIERQIESLRMTVAENPNENFPPPDSLYKENGVTLSWRISTVNKMGGPTVVSTNVRQCDLIAFWGNRSYDSLKVTTFIAKSF